MRPNSVSHPKTRPMCVCLFALWECGNVHGWSSFLTSWYVHPVWRALFNIIFVVFFYLKTILTMWLAEYHITRFFFALYPKFTTTKLLKSMDNNFCIYINLLRVLFLLLFFTSTLQFRQNGGLWIQWVSVVYETIIGDFGIFWPIVSVEKVWLG